MAALFGTTSPGTSRACGGCELDEAVRGRLVDIAVGQHDVLEDEFQDIVPLQFQVECSWPISFNLWDGDLSYLNKRTLPLKPNNRNAPDIRMGA